MQRHLRLVESDFEKMEKRRLPRFPFCYLIFKETSANENVYEVKDISETGMQLCLKNGSHLYSRQDTIGGNLSWLGNTVECYGQVQWIRGDRVGVAFSSSSELKESLKNFLTIEDFSMALKPIHKLNLDVELPPKLKYWLRSDGPVEVFIWTHSDGEISSFQFLIMEQFVEWVDGKGIQTGRVISKRDVDTPLVNTDEFVFQIDEYIDDVKLARAKALSSLITQDKLPLDMIKFLKLKLGI
ncbi:MAG: PilZ domain-containing protein [Bacteriovoracaceae bacterium]|jgi:hypothetical protein|nr:PilZ domain-containing protein [Bacteriovoracaceae bacterium]